MSLTQETDLFWPLVLAGGIVCAGVGGVLLWLQIERLIDRYIHGRIRDVP